MHVRRHSQCHIRRRACGRCQYTLQPAHARASVQAIPPPARTSHPDENSAPAVFSINTVSPPNSTPPRACQALLAACPAKRSRMQHQVICAQGRAALQLTAKRSNRLPPKLLVPSRQIDQIIRMNDERLQIIFLSQPRHCLALRTRQCVRLPLPRARRKDLERVAAQPVSAFGSILHAAGNRRVNANAPSRQTRRSFRRRPFQWIFFSWIKVLHNCQLKSLHPLAARALLTSEYAVRIPLQRNALDTVEGIRLRDGRFCSIRSAEDDIANEVLEIFCVFRVRGSAKHVGWNRAGTRGRDAGISGSSGSATTNPAATEPASGRTSAKSSASA